MNDYIPIYYYRRRNWHLNRPAPCEDKEPEYWTRMPVDISFGVMRTLRWRKRLKYGYERWRLQNGAFRKRQDT